MKILPALLSSVLSHKIYDSSGTDVETVQEKFTKNHQCKNMEFISIFFCILKQGLLTEYEVNEIVGNDLFEGDIQTDNDSSVRDSDQKNIQMDLSYRWPNGLLKFEVGPDVLPNVVGVFHQAIRELELKSSINYKPG
jgi:hypothetical protein